MEKRNITSNATYPGGSKSRVNKAGDNIRLNKATDEDYRVVEEWREAHRAALNTFQAILRTRAKGKDISVAQRHKRKRTVFDKLLRLPSMSLSRMDDVAGCRIIFKDVSQLHEFRSSLHKARFRHELRNKDNIDKYDYIKSPKPTGYRGIHDIYSYDVNSNIGRYLTGLYVEIQYRTLIQHAWSTAVEVIGLITESEPKFQRGDKRIEHAMALASEILARAHESLNGPFPQMSDRELVTNFLAADDQIGLLRMLKDLNSSGKDFSTKKNTILMFSDGQPLRVLDFKDATDALRKLFELENKFPEMDIVLVKADSTDEIRLAFKNYFFDAHDFVELVESGCTKLTSTKNISQVYRTKSKSKNK